ncbi:class I SAM-dependent DNA methyltransferase [Rhodococcus hoagii]|uniref:site-specific DNA-methyltransferase (adenine-specific) n=1 Tax=Rhodococcus hoagii (strain 103S) TaxID=685727 RepID=A0A3S5Y5A9_RHOH1|nr:DNA methyltransferase [Prescottella equi]MDP8016230.1 class I SAM-dependent DNA methyltransferase [Prescottella equi]NKR85922.1 class I SAM-dependent DNA methyltransferase [Prescottella equi]NKS05932.1 class I SAM-dependent DNA methyltransferase [Prescottella equi]NKS94770.1 class I SAM-dependent DNA methyltransferase [Prescottella equi]NKT08158.1 class I SAM-dependent DNA methyltransferase [Prescottella equi]
MASFDSIVIGEDWISEHYFTTDSAKESFHGKVLELRKLWDAEKKEERTTVRDDLLAATGDLQTALAALAENPNAAAEAHALTRTTFGYPVALSTFTAERAGSELEIPNAQLDGVTSVVFLQAVPVTSIEELLDPGTGQLITPAIEDGKPIESASKAVSAAFRSDTPPAFVVVQAGQWLLLAEAERWAEGRYLGVDLLVVAERRHEAKGGEIDRVAAMFGKQALLPDADGTIWWTGVLEDSVKHTVGVSKDLREGIRLSIEIIANEVVRRRADQGLTLDGIEGQDLAKHSLRFLYRILFLLYAEASPEMRVLPTGAAEYEEGYGLDRLRELTLTELVSEQARTGTHLYESLATLFRLVDRGHSPAVREVVADDPAPGLEFQPLRADLFKPESTALIDEVGLGNEATQRVLEHLLLSKEAKGRKGAERGFISYAELGINQLGAVYEGLMSYTGFFAEEDLYEVAKNGDPEKGSWVVPVNRSDHLDEKDFVRVVDEATGEEKPVLHRKGTFVFRLAGRERQQSASYYTPEVLTKFVVSQALEELLDQDDERTTPEQILQLAICEPALGSGAFAIEAVRQLAAEYLKRKQEDLSELIDADQYPIELQKVKAHIALHQVYGVDLNATAVELAEISLWLDTMVAGLQAPWFGLHLRRGNSLIGARRSVYAPSLLAKKQWLKTPAKDVPLGEVIGAGIHHFLLPSEGWGAVIDTAEAKTYAPEKREELRLWRTEIRKSPSKAIVKRLQALAQRVETLWEFTLRRLTIAESEIRRDIHLWGSEPVEHTPVVTREEIENVLNNPNGAYQRLRRVMDAWCAIWSWPLTTDVQPPDWEQWVGGLEAVVGVPVKETAAERRGQLSIGRDTSWQELGFAEGNDLLLSRAMTVGHASHQFPWLEVSQEIAEAQGFFHWELDFAPVFARGGFDLQVGNPPWVRPDWDEAAVLAEFDPWWQLTDKPAEIIRQDKLDSLLALTNPALSLLDERALQAGIAEHLGSETDQPLLTGLRTDLYRCFMTSTWRHVSSRGIVGLIHPESHFTENRASGLRRATYEHLRRHWQFRNELRLFSEINNTREYGVHIYGPSRGDVNFLQAASIFHPETVANSLRHDGSGPVPGLKSIQGKWNTTPHRNRIVEVDAATLGRWSALMDEPGSSPLEARMLYPINTDSALVLNKLSDSARLGLDTLHLSWGWDEGAARKNGLIHRSPTVPTQLDQSIIQGPQITVANPLYQQPNATMRNNRDYQGINLESIGIEFIPRTIYSPNVPYLDYMAAYPKTKGEPSCNFYRIAWRRMADSATVRTLHSAIIPPGPCTVSTVPSATADFEDIAVANGIWSSICVDFFAKVTGTSDMTQNVVRNFPHIRGNKLESNLILRVLRLNCLTKSYSEFWSTLYQPAWQQDSWVPRAGFTFPGRAPLGRVGEGWEWTTPLRTDADRRQAMIEIDAIVAVMLGITADELLTIYRTQFPVLQKYERDALYDATGRQLPTKLASEYRKKGYFKPADLTVDGVTYQEPFTGVDRELDLATAHKHFTNLLQEKK